MSRIFEIYVHSLGKIYWEALCIFRVRKKSSPHEENSPICVHASRLKRIEINEQRNLLVVCIQYVSKIKTSREYECFIIDVTNYRLPTHYVFTVDRYVRKMPKSGMKCILEFIRENK